MARLLQAIADSENEYPDDDSARVNLTRRDALDAAKRITELRRERDDALRVADIVRDLATPPISDADVEAAVAEARRVSPQITG